MLADFGEQQVAEPGTIIMWSGLLSNIPTGWALCDGANGTVDMRGRFLRGVENIGDPDGATGGQDSYTISAAQMGPHTHGGSTSTDGDHWHYVNQDSHAETTDGSYDALATSSTSTNPSKYSGTHTHSISVGSTGSGAAVDNLPQYYELAFLMKL